MVREGTRVAIKHKAVGKLASTVGTTVSGCPPCLPRKWHVRNRIRLWASVAVCEVNVISADVNDYPNLRRIIASYDGYSRTLFTFAGLVFPNITDSEFLVLSLL